MFVVAWILDSNKFSICSLVVRRFFIRMLTVAVVKCNEIPSSGRCVFAQIQFFANISLKITRLSCMHFSFIERGLHKSAI